MVSHEPEVGLVPFAPDDPLLRAAVAMFERDGWIDLRLLAKEAGIGRATLYRRYGDRDRVLGEALWAVSVAIMKEVAPGYRGCGAQGIAETIGAVTQRGADMPAMRHFVSQHTDTALRVMTSKHGVVQGRFIAEIAKLIELELGEPPDIDATTLAYGVQRIIESFYYRDLITGDPADIPAATVIITRLLTYQPREKSTLTRIEPPRPR
ncbi:QsdR family transcriptional regulator [Nocardia salmonicida]|uniref:QsdR family transcriptional regulator n=1 Tax=Nocardia salmonicida TaxID=53431 RepID=UPI003CE9B58E